MKIGTIATINAPVNEYLWGRNGDSVIIVWYNSTNEYGVSCDDEMGKCVVYDIKTDSFLTILRRFLIESSLVIDYTNIFNSNILYSQLKYIIQFPNNAVERYAFSKVAQILDKEVPKIYTCGRNANKLQLTLQVKPNGVFEFSDNIMLRIHSGK